MEKPDSTPMWLPCGLQQLPPEEQISHQTLQSWRWPNHTNLWFVTDKQLQLCQNVAWKFPTTEKSPTKSDQQRVSLQFCAPQANNQCPLLRFLPAHRSLQCTGIPHAFPSRHLSASRKKCNAQKCLKPFEEPRFDVSWTTTENATYPTEHHSVNRVAPRVECWGQWYVASCFYKTAESTFSTVFSRKACPETAPERYCLLEKAKDSSNVFSICDANRIRVGRIVGERWRMRNRASPLTKTTETDWTTWCSVTGTGWSRCSCVNVKNWTLSILQKSV